MQSIDFIQLQDDIFLFEIITQAEENRSLYLNLNFILYKIFNILNVPNLYCETSRVAHTKHFLSEVLNGPQNINVSQTSLPASSTMLGQASPH